MKKIIFLIIVSFLSLRAFGNGVIVTIVNVGTNSVNAGISITNVTGGFGFGVVLPGTTATNIDGAGSYQQYWVQWSANAGGPTAFVVGPIGNGSSANQAPNQYGPIPVCGNGIPTNCTDTLTICNQGIAAQSYQLLNAGVPSGSVTVLGGGCQTMTFANPGCVPGRWSYYAIPNYIDLGAPGYSPYNPGIGPGDNSIVPANSSTSISPTPGNPAPNNSNSQYPIAPYNNNSNFTNSNTNGPINYGTNLAVNPTNAANNGTIEATGNALYTATVQSEQGIVDAIKTMDQANRAGHAGTSNELNMVTNLLGTMTNELAALTNGYGTNNNPTGNAFNIWSNTISTITNAVGSALSTMTNGWGGLAGGLNTNVSLGTPPDSYTFNLPAMPDASISPPSLQVSLAAVQSIQTLAPVKGVVSWVILLTWFFKYCQHAEWAVQRLFAQRQLQGNKQMVEAATFGGNVSVVTALVYAGIFAAIVGIIPTVIAVSTTDLSNQANSFIGNVTTVSSWPIWSFVNAAVPLDLVMYSFLNYLVFRFLICDMVLWVLLGIIFAMAE